MPHTAYEKLSDLKDILKIIRKWPKIKEPKPGIFYIKSKPFLHFHDKDEKRWVDMRKGIHWGPSVEIPFNPSDSKKRKFLKKVEEYYRATLID